MNNISPKYRDPNFTVPSVYMITAESEAYTDLEGTILAKVGEPVALLGSGSFRLIQATESNRPTLRSDGGLNFAKTQSASAKLEKEE